MSKNIIKLPKSICFRLTRYCNAQCPFCLAPFEKQDDKMSLEEVKQILEILKTTGLNNVKLSGGEPYTRKDINEIINYCGNIKLQPVVATNGILLSDTNIDALSKNNAKVKISLHGFEEAHNKFTNLNKYKEIVQNIKKLINKNIFVSLHTIVNSLNVDYINDFIKEYRDMGIKKISFIPLSERGRQLEHKNKIQGISSNDIKEKIIIWQNNFPDMDLRFLDFSKDYYVIENDRSLWIQRGTDFDDTFICKDILSKNLSFKLL